MMSVKLWQSITFSVTFFAMTMRHSCLGAWSLSKAYIGKDLGFTSSVFGALDSTYLVFYSQGNFICGALGDRFPIRYVMSIGVAVASLCYFLVTPNQIVLLGLYQISSSVAFALLFAVGGFAQSGVLPGGVALVSNWFSVKLRGRVMGFWSSNHSVGDALGQLVGGLMFGVLGMTWEGVITANSSLLMLAALLCLLFLHDRPSELGHYEPLPTDDLQELSSEPTEAITFWQGLVFPG
jgi:OPA family glycerol-3-phosphate transporter-like MFS transporter 3